VWTIVGTIADSIAGLGTLGALIVAVAVYRRQAQNTKSAQASRVFAYIELSSITALVDHQKTRLPVWKVRVMNFSDLPIYDVGAYVSSEKMPAQKQNSQTVYQASTPAVDRYVHAWAACWRW
jgi:hypothetical protein